MRSSLILLVVLSGSLALAQNMPGSYGGYVSGWVGETPRGSAFGGYGYAPYFAPRLTPAQLQYLALQQVASQQYFFAQQQLVVSARQQEVAAQQFAQQQEALTLQRRQAREQELAAQEQRLAQQQQLAVQQQILAQQQQQAAADERARVVDREEKLKVAEAEQKLELEREAARLALARAEADAKPREKGPDIHRWVDEDGVVHYSTRPPKR